MTVGFWYKLVWPSKLTLSKKLEMKNMDNVWRSHIYIIILARTGMNDKGVKEKVD